MSSVCHGKVPNKSMICAGLVFKCTKCGAVGCKTKDCSNQKFNNGQCVVCGSYGTTKPI